MGINKDKTNPLSETKTVKPNDLKGFEGWLALFVATSTAGIALTLFYIITNNLSYFYLLFIPIQGYVLYSVWKARPNAVFLVRSMLIINFVYLILSMFINTPETASFFLFSTIINLVWILYFAFSKRVKATFPKEHRKVHVRDYVIVVLFLILTVIGLMMDLGTTLETPVESTNDPAFFEPPLAPFTKPDLTSSSEELEDSSEVIYLKGPQYTNGSKVMKPEVIDSFVKSECNDYCLTFGQLGSYEWGSLDETNSVYVCQCLDANDNIEASRKYVLE